LRRRLVLAKRERVKQEYQQELHLLDERIHEYLSKQTPDTTTASSTSTSSSLDKTNARVRVQDLMNALQKTSTLDVHVHIHRRWREGRWRCFSSSGDDLLDHENTTNHSSTTANRTTLVPMDWCVELLNSSSSVLVK
jgi:hypothetical protein